MAYKKAMTAYQIRQIFCGHARTRLLSTHIHEDLEWADKYDVNMFNVVHIRMPSGSESLASCADTVVTLNVAMAVLRDDRATYLRNAHTCGHIPFFALGHAKAIRTREQYHVVRRLHRAWVRALGHAIDRHNEMISQAMSIKSGKLLTQTEAEKITEPMW